MLRINITRRAAEALTSVMSIMMSILKAKLWKAGREICELRIFKEWLTTFWKKVA